MRTRVAGWLATLLVAVTAASLSGVVAPPAQSAPARPEGPAQPTVSGTTALTLDDSVIARWASVGVRLAVRPPAALAGATATLPLTQLTDTAFHHRGELMLVGPTGVKVALADLIIRRGSSGDVDVTTPLGKDALMRTESVTSQELPVRKRIRGPITTTIRTTKFTGELRLTRDAATVLTLNGALGAYALAPGERLGTVTTSLVEKTTTIRPRAAARTGRANDPRLTYQVKTKDPVVFITIDDGIITPKEALDYVEKHSIPITSFLTSSQVTDSKARYFERISRWGSIQNHTTTHASLDTSDSGLIHRQVCPVQTSFRDRFGTKPWMLRPPYGAGPRGTTLQSVVSKCGITDIVMWDALVENGRLATATSRGLVPGSVILLHFTGNLAWDLKVAVSTARAAGLRPANLAEYLPPPAKRR